MTQATLFIRGPSGKERTLQGRGREMARQMCAIVERLGGCGNWTPEKVLSLHKGVFLTRWEGAGWLVELAAEDGWQVLVRAYDGYVDPRVHIG